VRDPFNWGDLGCRAICHWCRRGKPVSEHKCVPGCWCASQLQVFRFDQSGFNQYPRRRWVGLAGPIRKCGPDRKDGAWPNPPWRGPSRWHGPCPNDPAPSGRKGSVRNIRQVVPGQAGSGRVRPHRPIDWPLHDTTYRPNPHRRQWDKSRAWCSAIFVGEGGVGSGLWAFIAGRAIRVCTNGRSFAVIRRI